LVPWLAGIPIRLGRSSDGRGFLLTGRYRPDARSLTRHEVEYYLGLVNHFGIAGTTTKPYVTTTESEDAQAAELLEGHGVGADDFILGINPGASFGSAKRWYPERFAEVARRLADTWSARVVIFGGPGETDIAAQIEQLLAGNCINLAGTTTVRELMAMIRRSNFFITNDSGPMHIAAAFGVPLAAIFGSTDSTTTSPYSDKAVVVRKDIDCAPCKLRECPIDHRCMTAVTSDDVVQAALGCLHKINNVNNSTDAPIRMA
jgi:heptosyltransferase-2